MGNDFKRICNSAILRSGFNETRNINEAYERLFLTLIEQNKYDHIECDYLLNDFNSFYKVNINHLLLDYYINKLKKSGYIKKVSDGLITFDIEKIGTLNLVTSYESLNTSFEILKKHFLSFCKQKHFIVDEDKVETIIGNFIEENVNNLGLNQGSDDLNSSKEEYIAVLYIKEIKNNNKEIYEIFKTMLFGRMFAVFISGSDKAFTYEEKSFKKMKIYLDSGFVFNLLGLNLFSTQDEYSEMVNTLRSLGASFKIFRHTYDEVGEIIFNSKDWVENNRNYQISKANNVTKYFIQNRKTKAEIEEFYYSLETALSAHGIEIDDYSIDYNEVDTVSEENFKTMLLNEYETNGRVKEDRMGTYELDAKSLYMIHKKRGSRIYRKLSDVEHIFLTSNKAISKISNKFNREHYKGTSISYSFSDTFLNLLLYFSYGNYSSDVNDRFLMPAAFHAFEPSKEMLIKLEAILTKYDKNKTMSEQAIIDWKTNTVLIDAVVNDSCNNPDEIDEETPSRVIKKFEDNANIKVMEKEKENTKLATLVANMKNDQIVSNEKEIGFLLNQKQEAETFKNKLLKSLHHWDAFLLVIEFQFCLFHSLDYTICYRRLQILIPASKTKYFDNFSCSLFLFSPQVYFWFFKY